MVAPAPTVTVVRLWVKSELVAWSIWKPVWLLALFVQLRLIWLEEAAVAVRPLGAAGTVMASRRQSGVGEPKSRHLPLSCFRSLEEIRRHHLELDRLAGVSRVAVQVAVTVVHGEF